MKYFRPLLFCLSLPGFPLISLFFNAPTQGKSEVREGTSTCLDQGNAIANDWLRGGISMLHGHSFSEDFHSPIFTNKGELALWSGNDMNSKIEKHYQNNRHWKYTQSNKFLVKKLPWFLGNKECFKIIANMSEKCSLWELGIHGLWRPSLPLVD